MSTLRRRGEAGTTIVELMVALFFVSLFGGVFWALWSGFFRDVFFAERLGAIQRELRPAITELTTALREADVAEELNDGSPVRELADDRIVVWSDVDPTQPGP